MNLLEVRDLSVTFGAGTNAVEAVKRVSFDIGRGETVARMLATGDGDDIAVFRAVQVKVAIPSGSSFRAEPRSGGVEESQSSR